MAYARDESDGYREIDRFDDGVGWIAHREEFGQRASHAVRGEEGIWLVDPLRAPGVGDLIAALEDDVVGVTVCSCWHARDADWFAREYDVPVSVPEWMGRIEERTDAPVRRYDDRPAPTIRVQRCEPVPMWSEAILFWESHETLYVPDSMGTLDPFVVGNERIGLELFRRLAPPRSLRRLEPDRILVGHGDGVFEDATRALENALAGGRRRFPRALFENGPGTVRSLVGAIRE
ncbi:hypothetical protein EA462_07575 [Natrarchaeobius halalkaliphilus]|uniref:MBL fold metallo-hydrolase n=1 Tax=Natrarchaeobius halalkaliphilus TaxID=1679091 RepID=A0A3N6M8S3_9EURY|nr:hypothetical protein [Natrarchaeobius halalkaliphilus]RQG89866.1 hypothetical protein EA462_07575 [Natrarchaeobius halalkaliphilus]